MPAVDSDDMVQCLIVGQYPQTTTTTETLPPPPTPNFPPGTDPNIVNAITQIGSPGGYSYDVTETEMVDVIIPGYYNRTKVTHIEASIDDNGAPENNRTILYFANDFKLKIAGSVADTLNDITT